MNLSQVQIALEAGLLFNKTDEDRRKINAKVLKFGLASNEDPTRFSTRMDLIPEIDGLGRERVIGSDDLMFTNYLTQGHKASQSVCLIHLRNSRGRPVGYGTGFLVSPNLMITNNHVFKVEEHEAQFELGEYYINQSLVQFEFEYNDDYSIKSSSSFRLAPDRFFYTDVNLDFALIAIQPTSLEGHTHSNYGYLPLIGASGKGLLKEKVTIVQHPKGSYKQVALRNNEILEVLDSYIHYNTDTLPGSSGSPVFNDQWQVVALHQTGVPATKNGEIVAKDGKKWDPRLMTEDQIDWIANKGIRISSIITHLASKHDWSDSQLKLLREMGVIPQKEIKPEADSSSVATEPPLSFARERLINPTRGVRGLASETRIARDVYDPSENLSKEHNQITLTEFRKLIEDNKTTEDDIAPYIIQDENLSRAFDPIFRVNTTLVVDITPFESDRPLTWANGWCQFRRNQAYRSKLANGDYKRKIVSEGDSWFQYPFLLHDVIDNLMDDPDNAILSLDAAGDLLIDMIESGEYLQSISSESPGVFLISGGGNDLVGDSRIAKLLHPYSTGRKPSEYLNDEFIRFINETKYNYQRLFQSVLQINPKLKVVCHGYDYVVPNGGRWLGKPMESIGITNSFLQYDIMKVIIDEVNSTLADITRQFNQVNYMDLRGIIPLSGWYDELHPLDPGYQTIASYFSEVIRKIT